jgi:hypothetical protein
VKEFMESPVKGEIQVLLEEIMDDRMHMRANEYKRGERDLP